MGSSLRSCDGSIPLSTKQSTCELAIEGGTAQTQHRPDEGNIPAGTKNLEASPNLFDSGLYSPWPSGAGFGDIETLWSEPALGSFGLKKRNWLAWVGEG